MVERVGQFRGNEGVLPDSRELTFCTVAIDEVVSKKDAAQTTKDIAWRVPPTLASRTRWACCLQHRGSVCEARHDEKAMPKLD